MKKVPFKDAIGEKLAHDICEIKPGVVKGRAFKRGYVIKQEDEAYFNELGKQHFYIMSDEDSDLIHEEDAAMMIAQKLNNGDFYYSDISLGKISLIANHDGFFEVSTKDLTDFNMLGDLSVATINRHRFVKKGDIVCSLRIVPLYIDKDKLNQILSHQFENTIVQIKPIEVKRVCVITTGSEVYNKKIEDGFYPVLKEKFNNFNLEIDKQYIVDDKMPMIKERLSEVLTQDYDLVLMTGGMSVDPDDLTPGAIKECGVDIITYGTPIIPGSMFLYGYHNDTVVMGLPGAVIYETKTAFDLLLPYSLMKQKITKRDIMSYSHGGLLDG